MGRPSKMSDAQCKSLYSLWSIYNYIKPVDMFEKRVNRKNITAVVFDHIITLTGMRMSRPTLYKSLWRGKSLTEGREHGEKKGEQ